MAKAPTNTTPATSKKPDQAAPAAEAAKADAPAETTETKAVSNAAPPEAETQAQVETEAKAPEAEAAAEADAAATEEVTLVAEVARPLQALRAAANSLRGGARRPRVRVLPSGKTVEDTVPGDDPLVRTFTAASRILRDGVLYEVGAPVPLTLREFEAKRRAGAVAEKIFLDGAEAD
mgnify:CR=1 FL=1|tara:strand:- start:11267 stop:11797 length:531 start_codon:yes stop_codon:yes gene_type:complete